MKFIRFSVILCLAFGIGMLVYSVRAQNAAMERELATLREAAERLREENRGIQDKIKYYENPENLLKASRASFNYREPGETMLIITGKSVKAATTTATTTEKQNR